MIRHEAFVQKEWQETGLAQVLVVRHDESGLVDFAFFLVDFWCLGVKDTFHENDVPVAEFNNLLQERLPEDFQERIHPACAKKLIEGAISYAEQFGFSPCRDFRKSRKILSPIDASICPTEFSFGRDGKPCYVEGTLDTPERVDKVLSILEAHCGLDGFTYEPFDDDEDAEAELREDLRDFLDAQTDDVPRFYHISGLITAMLLSPQAVSPGDLLEYLNSHGLELADQEEAQYFADLIKDYWNYLNTIILDAIAPDAPKEIYVVDIDAEDFPPDDQDIAVPTACIEWCKGFFAAVERWPEHWRNTLARPELMPSCEVIRNWANFAEPGSWEKIQAAADSDPSNTLGKAAVTLVRALRKP